MSSIEIPYVGRYSTSSPADKINAERVVDLIETQPDCFGRSSDHGHITASAVVINSHANSILMTFHTKLNRWLQLGGHCDGLRDPLFVAKKEGYEESGLTHLRLLEADVLDIDIHVIPKTGDQNQHLHYDIRYLFCGDDKEPLQMSKESKSLRWVPFERLHDFTDDWSILRLVERVSL